MTEARLRWLTPSPTVLWLVVGAVSTFVVVIVFALLRFESATPGVRSPTGQRRNARGLGGQQLHIAGSGSNVPLTRTLAAAYEARQGAKVTVHDSIGSTGGVQALIDGVIDLAMVSRPLKPDEQQRNPTVWAYARVPIVIVVAASVVDRDVTRDQLVAMYDGNRTTWSDGAPIMVMQRERGDSSHAAVARILPGFAQANERAYVERRWRVLYHDDMLLDAVASTPGAVGLSGQGRLGDERLRALTVDGVAPRPKAVLSGAYPFAKELAFVSIGALPPSGRRFLDFIYSEFGQTAITEAGAVALQHQGDR